MAKPWAKVIIIVFVYPCFSVWKGNQGKISKNMFFGGG